MNKRFIPSIMTLVIMIFIISITGIARLSLKLNEEFSVPTISSSIELIEDKGLNESEKSVLTMISCITKFPENQAVKENNRNTDYFNYLREYLNRAGVDLSANVASEMEDLIKDRDSIMKLEKENDVNRMSFDGREVTIYILEHIYELSGLELAINAEGDIKQITDLSGNIIYLKDDSMEQEGFQVEALVISLTTLLTLLGICIIIAKKNQLFVKGGRYDGFDEKEFA